MKGETEAPPSYNSIFDQLKEKKEQSGGLVDYTKNASGVVKSKVGGACSKVMQALCLGSCNFGLPVAEIVIGVLFWNDCPVNIWLARYLVIMGSVSLVAGSFSIWLGSTEKKDCENEEGSLHRVRRIIRLVNGFINGYLFCWFIAGNVFVFRMKACDMTTFSNTTMDCFTTDEAYKDSDLYCKQLLYDFVFWETIVRWILVGLVFVLVFTCCCVICCAYCCCKSSPKESHDMS